jgi:hypothetical protein
MVRYASRFKPLAAALAALAATLILGAFGPATAAPAGLLGWEAFGLAVTGGAGLLAWHLAALTALPVSAPARAAMPAALVPLLILPQAGAAALLVPAALALALPRADRFAAGLALAGTFAALGAGPIAQIAAAATMLAAAWLCRARSPAANDNPSLKRFWPLPKAADYATEIGRDSGTELGSSVNVQRQ